MAEKDTKSKSAAKPAASKSNAKPSSTAASKTTAQKPKAAEKPAPKTADKSKPAAKTGKPATKPAAKANATVAKSVKESPKTEKTATKTDKQNASASKAKSQPAKAEQPKSKTGNKSVEKQTASKSKATESKATAEKSVKSAKNVKTENVVAPPEAKTKGNAANKTDKKSTEDKPKAKSSAKHAEEEVLAASVKDGVSKSEKAKTEKSSVSAKEKNEQPNSVKTNKEVTESKEKTSKKTVKDDSSATKNNDKKGKDKNKSPQHAQMSKQKKKSIIIGVVCAAVVFAIILGIILGVKSCQNGSADAYRYDYSNTTVVGYYGKQISTIKRVRPVSEVKNEGLPAYPKYGYTLSSVIGAEHDADRQALINESSYLTATGTWNGGGGNFTWMDKDGYLYRGTTSEPIPTVDTKSQHRQLYRHTTAEGLYFGDVSDSEPGVVKEMIFRPRSYTRGYNVTGLYAPAGEVIKVEISEKDMKATGGITFHIGQALYNGKANNIWTAKGQMQRFPVIMNTMSVTPDTATLKDGVYTAYIGSFVGGPIYVRNESVSFKITVSGGVNYSHFILGYTTKDEFERNAESTAPYFDLEVWDNGVLHSGPKKYSEPFSYDDLYKAAVLWEKVSLVTTTGNSQGIVFLYDPFVAAGAAVAFPGQGAVNCPTGWMASSLNYKSITTSGSWGNFHEYHHNFQGYGVGNGGEVTNNGMTLVSYALFTKISSSRGLGSNGAEGLGGWNSYTSATWALEEVLKISAGGSPSNGKQGLALYATLLHNFGPDKYIQAKTHQRGGQNYVAYLKAWQEVTHNDMTYYFKDLLQGISEAEAQELSNPEYSKFVPVSSVYQTGRSYMYDGEKQYITTMQPYVINYGEDFDFDLNPYTDESGQYLSGSIKLPKGFSYKIKDVKQPQYGSVTPKGNNVYTYTPDKKEMNSGDIIVTLQITKDDDPSFKVDDVDLVLGFEQTHEKNKFVLQRTTYTYDAGSMYTDAEVAYENNYANYSSKTEGDNLNGTQNSNTDIWLYPNNDKYKDSPYVVKDNTIAEVKGKLYFKDAGKYRLYLRGRINCAMYYSIGNEDNYQLGGKIKTLVNNSHLFRTGDPNTYVDIEVGAESWVYFKSVLIIQSSPAISYMGLGYAQWTEPMFTIHEIKDEDGNVIGVKYYDYMGREVSEEEANKAELIPPTKASYVTAYRNDYEFPSKEFEADYFYTRKYNYNYVGDTVVVTEGKKQTPTSYCNYMAWDPTQHSIDNLFDGKSDTGIHFSRDWGVSANKPAILAFDIGETITANSMTLYTYLQTGSNSKGFPQNFTLEGSLDGTEYFDMGTWTGQGQPAVSKDFLLKDGKSYTFRYYRLTITATGNGRCALNGLTFSNTLRFQGDGNNLFSPDNEMFKFSKKWSSAQAYSMFGHVYTGKKGDTMTFEFEGTNFAILSSSNYDNKFEVKIDGNVISSLELKSEKDDIYVSYLSEILESGKHKVEIKCKGKASIDSIAIFK